MWWTVVAAIGAIVLFSEWRGKRRRARAESKAPSPAGTADGGEAEGRTVRARRDVERAAAAVGDDPKRAARAVRRMMKE